jgi:general secretion pathway protein G
MRQPRRRGFSARELIAGIIVLVACAFILMRQVAGSSVADQRTTTILRLQQIEKALRDYAIDNGGRFPTTDQELGALLTPPTRPPLATNWRGPYLKDAKTIQDAWGRPFQYAAPGSGTPPECYAVWSNGADDQEGGQGADADINSSDRRSQLP